jgi:hydrogenase maturation protease
MAKTLVVGIGNADRGDDGVGLLVARLVRNRAPRSVRVVEVNHGGADLLDVWEGAKCVVVVDAMRTQATPGTLRRFDAGEGPLPMKTFGTLSHAIGLAEAVELGRELGRLPSRIVVLGIEGESFEHGADVSPILSRAAWDAVERVLEEIRCMNGH